MKFAPFDRLELDRLIERDARRVRTFRLAMAAGELPELPTLSARTSRLAMRDELLEYDPDPIGKALVQHVSALTLFRVTLPDERRVAEERLHPHQLSGGASSVRDELRALLLLESNRGRTLERLAQIGGGVQDATRSLFARRAEAARRLGFADARAALSPPSEPKLIGELFEGVQQTLDRIGEADLPPHELPLRALARDAGEGYPAALGTSWLRGLFGRGELIRGLSLPRMNFPRPLGAMSFVRALGSFGELLPWQDRDRTVPFSLCRDPVASLALKRGCLFASLLFDPVFLRRRLQLGRDRARTQGRQMVLAATAVLRMTLAAAVTAQAFSAEKPPRSLTSELERCLGQSIPPELVGVFPAADPFASDRLWALAAAFADRARLISEFDEDWFDNPKAHEALRHEHQVLSPASGEVGWEHAAAFAAALLD